MTLSPQPKPKPRRVFEPTPDPDGVVKLVCDIHGVQEERISYSAVPARLNGCREDDNPCIVRIAGYDWDRDPA